MRTITFILGIALTIFSFIALTVYGQARQPVIYSVVVAGEKIEDGERLDISKLRVAKVTMPSGIIDQYLQEKELPEYAGAIVQGGFLRGELIQKSRLIHSSNPLGEEKVTLALDKPSFAAISLPSSKVIIPEGVERGQCLDLIVGFPRMDKTGEPGMMKSSEVIYPLAKAIVRGAKVLRVEKEMIPNPQYGTVAGVPPYIFGRVLGITVVIPREVEELVKFALDSGSLQAVILSPLVCQEIQAPSPGFTAEDFERLFTLEREMAMGLTMAPVTVTVPVSAETTTPVPTPAAAQVSTPTPVPTLSTPTPVPTRFPVSGLGSSNFLLNILCMGVPSLAFFLLLAFILMRRRR
ncbi:MAG: hypothetical protein QW356_00820 [Candidatus Hadarchaeales archaeon]